MTRASSARQHRRAMRRAGVELAVREVVQFESRYESATDSIRHHVGVALYRLEVEGADMTSRIAITIGNDHPNFPGQTVVEAKASRAVAPRASFDYQADAVDNDRDDAGQ